MSGGVEEDGKQRRIPEKRRVRFHHVTRRYFWLLLLPWRLALSALDERIYDVERDQERIHDGQRHEQLVEAARGLLPAQDGQREEVAHQAHAACKTFIT